MISSLALTFSIFRFVIMRRLFVCVFVIISFQAAGQKDSCTILYTVEGMECAYPRLSSDQHSVLYQSNETGKWQIFVMDLINKSQYSITSDTFNNNFPDWNFDNRMIAFVSDRDGNEEVYLFNRDNNTLKRITQDAGRDIHPYFSPDGKFILFNSTRGNNSFDIYKYEIQSGITTRITETREDETCARFSPDMKKIVFLRNGGNTDDIFIMNVSNNVAINLTKTPYNLDGWPMWNNDGDKIYYSSFINGTYNIYRINQDGTGR